jgi:hypothetical protein
MYAKSYFSLDNIFDLYLIFGLRECAYLTVVPCQEYTEYYIVAFRRRYKTYTEYTCSMNYVGQSGRPITIRHREHIRYIKTNNPASAYATHILNNRREYGTENGTLKLIQPCRKSKKMNHWENMYIQIYRQQNLLITEQQVNEPNPLYELAQLPHAIRDSSQPNIPQTSTSGTHT